MELVESHWNLDNLEKAYRHGFMAGMVGKPSAVCPYKAEVIANAWEAGWQDGREQFDLKQSLARSESL
ncbi:ribosome modulation factor [Bermanella sp. 47_1433_sub80_T6]|nr:ribosome modulation factor [Bermanella sp. 47_1433_sub80_T6]